MATRRRAALLTVPLVVAFSSAVGVSPAQAAAPLGGAAAVLARMSEEQRVGQLFMVGGAATGVDSSTRAAISSYHVGNVILTGRSSAGTAATAGVSRGLQALATPAATSRVPLFISTDQEGGYVQVLSGPGISTMPTGLAQGGLATTTLRSYAGTWGAQLRSAGVNVNLAPVMDTVPSAAAAPGNPPIGYYQREYGYTPAIVATQGTAFAQGMAAAGVDETAKHFPGLGRVTANPDTSAGVTDSVTTRTDAYLTPFAAAIDAGVPFVMMSTAYYAKIDPARPAAFSPTIVTGMLRGDLGFRGVIISDDLGNARQVAAWSPGVRAVDFIAAGGDLVLTVNAAVLPQMYTAVLAQANASATFRAQLNASALRVLIAKQRRGLIAPATRYDYNADGRADISVFRPSTGTWSFRGANSVYYGQSGDIPIPADYTGDGRTDVALFRPSTGTWYVHGAAALQYGQNADVPVPADYNGDGRADIALFRPSTGTWYFRGGTSVYFGESGDIPIPADYTGDGRTDIAVFRPSTGTWYVRGAVAVQYGQRGDVPAPADYTGDGRADIALFRPSTDTWSFRGGASVYYGRAGDIPIPADYTGDGRTDIALFRPSTGTWYIHGATALQYGQYADVPV